MMKSQKLLQAMNDIDDAFLLEAEKTLAQQKKPRKSPFKWFVIVLAILGLSSGAYAAIQWDSVFLAYFKPSVTLIEKLEGNVQNVDAVSDCETLILKINQTIGDENTIYLNLEVSLPDGQTWQDVLPKELTEGETHLDIQPIYHFYNGEFQYDDVKGLSESELNVLFKDHKFGPSHSGGEWEAVDLKGNSASYFIHYSTDRLSEGPVSLYISNFTHGLDSVIDGPFIISWVPENSGTQYKFEIEDKNGTRGSVALSAFRIEVKLYNYEKAEEYERATQLGRDIIIHYKDGTTQKVSSMTNGIGGSRGKNYLEYHTHFRSILDLDTVASIQVGPYTCELK